MVTGEMIAATAGRTAMTTAVTAGMTAAIGVPAPGYCGDSSMQARTPESTTPTPLSRAMRVHGSVTS